MSAADLRAAWDRRARLDCGCTLPCRCGWKARPTPNRVDAYAAAVRWLDRLGTPAAPLLPELAALARRGGDDRQLAETVLGRWAA